MSGRHDSTRLTNLVSLLSTTTITTTMLMMIFHPVVNGNVAWQATVATGHAPDAGTNGTIFIRFNGTVNTSDVHLSSLNGELFQRSQVDVFKIYTDYIGELLDLTIIHSEMSTSYTYLKWQLDYILMLELNTSTEYGFHYRNYIPENAYLYGEVKLQPDTIRQLTNQTIVSSSVDPSVSSTQNLFSFNTSTIYSQDFGDINASGFASGPAMIGSTPAMHTVSNGFVSSLTPDSFLLPTASTPLPNPKTFFSLLDSSPTKDVQTMDIIFPTSDIPFTVNIGMLFSTPALPDSTTAYLESKSRSSEMSGVPTTPCFSPCACPPTTEIVSPKGDLLSRMASVSRELTVDKKQLSRYKRKKSCAPDDRNSAKAMGFLALFVLALPVAYVILIDLSNYRKFLPESQRQRRSAKKKRIEKF